MVLSKVVTVVIVQRYLPHYRRPFFHQLVLANPDLDIVIYHGGELAGEDSQLSAPAHFPERRFRNYRLMPWFGYDIVAQPGVLWALLWKQPDVVILEGTFGIVTNMLVLALRKAQNRPTLYWTAGWDNPRVRGWRHRFKTAVIRILLRLVDGYIAYGSAARQYLVAHGADPAGVTVAQNTIDVESIIAREEEWATRGRALREQLGWTNLKVIVYVGGISRIKRLSVLAEAYEQLCARRSDLALLVVGDGQALAAMQTFVTEHALPNVHFAGAVVRDVEVYFAAGDLFVLPGTGGLALNQAMALSKPLIATIADGTEADLIEPGRNGYIARVDDVADLAACIWRIVDDPDLAKQMGQQSKQILLERATLAKTAHDFSTAIRATLK